MIFANILEQANQFQNISCGELGFNFSSQIPYITSLVIKIIKIAVPILLIIFGMLDLGKSVIAQKDDEIKKGQQTFIKRCIAAAIVFFVVSIVQLILNVVVGDDKNTVTECLKCFVNNECGVAKDSNLGLTTNNTQNNNQQSTSIK